ncbi:probable glycosyltransferase At3g07620 [Syzygium oleosum]|uniref:probable glycosyltransferase At3g07620 n=1 Tax=Syzygium oleosum TaxID=219896 RepID=UPI0011D1CCA3|nr:probable glycosyltransferase At3g07620 [Syzygium oleosum]
MSTSNAASSPTSSSSHRSFCSLLVLCLIAPLTLISVGLFALAGNGPSSRLELALPWKLRVGFVGSKATAALSALRPNDSYRAMESPWPMSYSEENQVAFAPPSAAENETLTEKLEPDEPAAIEEPVRVVKRYSRLERLEAGLSRARSAIREAALIRNLTSVHADADYVPRGPIYRNANAFHRSYLEMERLFKIYVYQEGEPPMFHDGPCKSIYSTEGRFIHEMERGHNQYRTMDPDEALVYFLPFSVVMLVQYLYEPGSHETHAIGRAVVDYVDVIAAKHPFWNRSLGADHFMLSCHDWGPHASSYVPYLFSKSIRVLCNANTSEGFDPFKDAPLPEINLKTGEISGLLGGPSPSRRSILAFFAGRLHGHIRHLLLQEWKDKEDPDVQVYDELPRGASYESMLRQSRYCLCPSGYEVASPRVVEAIYAECVPVLISDGYVPPFSDVLNWKAFSVQVQVRDIPNIKKILMGISQSQYLRMQRRVKQVQRHFAANGPPRRYDVFHMTVHSIWLRRLNIRIADST